MNLGKIETKEIFPLPEKASRGGLERNEYQRPSPLNIRHELRKEECSSVDGKRESFKVDERKHQSTRNRLN